MKTAVLFFCFCIVASSQVYGKLLAANIEGRPVEARPKPFTKVDCSLGVHQDDGPVCLAYIPVYRWSGAEQKCVKDVYGGCRPTNNNFNTEQDCIKTATPVCSN
uniref:Chymotrypsin inhibitor SCI-II-like n=1 Tax=Diabrotica virgifera virgifera TaxID=50390 RepID=A0A6P7F054_DIAVI